MFDTEKIWLKNYSLAILMPGRLLEVGPDKADRFRHKLREHCTKVLVYAYGDWREKYGGLKQLSQAAGFVIPEAEDLRAAIVTSC